jgi:hypothetical protein
MSGDRFFYSCTGNPKNYYIHHSNSFDVIKWLPVFFFFLFFSCSNSKPSEPPEGSWQLYDIDIKGSEADFATTAIMKQKVKDGSVIHLFEDNVYSELDGSGIFTSGRWDQREDNNLILTDNRSGNKSLDRKEERSQKEKFESLQMTKDGMIHKYRKTSSPLRRYKDDPFYPDNNDWRMKPSAPENDEALKKRLAAYFKHLSLLLKAAKERESQVVSFEYSQGCVKIYNGGIGIHSWSIVPDEWKDTFYNEEDAQKAYGIFEQYLENTSYKGAAVGDWVTDDYNILLSIYADFNK